MIGPYFFNLYVSSLSHEIEDIPFTLSGYAGDYNAGIVSLPIQEPR